MERDLHRKLDTIMGKPGVIGVVCADKQGLCLSARGVGCPEQAGIITNIANNARKLDPTSNASPIIRLESDHGYCLVQRKDDFTLGIFKKPQ